MNWERVTTYAERSTCGRYTVAASRVNGAYIFQSWRVPDSLVLHTGTSAECKAACERDAGKADLVEFDGTPIPETDLPKRPDER